MIDLLLSYGVPALLRHLDETKQKAEIDEKASIQKQVRSLAAAVRQATDTDKKQAEIIAGILKELNGLVPQSVSRELEAIYAWMTEHVESEQNELRRLAERYDQAIRQSMRRQLYWNVALALIGSSALAVALFAALK